MILGRSEVVKVKVYNLEAVFVTLPIREISKLSTDHLISGVTDREGNVLQDKSTEQAVGFAKKIIVRLDSIEGEEFKNIKVLHNGKPKKLSTQENWKDLLAIELPDHMKLLGNWFLQRTVGSLPEIKVEGEMVNQSD